MHCAEIDSYVDIARRAGIVDDREADADVAENVRAAEILGIPRAQVPGTRAELEDYFATTRPELALCDEARRGVGSLLTPQRHAPAAVAIALSSVAAAAFTTLPPWARRLYGLPGLPTTGLGVWVALRALRAVTAMLPDPPGPPEIERARRLVRAAS